jgi:hypothetical protein
LKILIAIVNCRSRQRTWAQAVRDTWLPFVPKDKADVFFFVGRGEPMELPSDTVALDCDDSYQGLPDKVREIVRWALAHGYDYMLKCDDDVVIHPLGLLLSGFDKFPYSGKYNRIPTHNDPFSVPMGFCYWLDKQCMKLVENAPLPENSNDDEKWVARNLYYGGITLHDEARYHLHRTGLIPANKRPIRVHRPLNRLENGCAEPERQRAFAWCIFLEGNSGDRIPVQNKIEEFSKVFATYCKPRLAEYGTKP